MTKKQKTAVKTLMGKTDTSCIKAMGEQFCTEHNGDCEKCLEDFRQYLFDNCVSCKCQWCERIGCGTYHSECEHYKAYQAEMERRRHAKELKVQTTYFKKKGKGV